MELSRIELIVVPEHVAYFTSILQWGICAEIETGTPLMKFLCTWPGLSATYIEDTVQTVFLNGLPVDDMQVPLTEEGSVIALSAAMPGLAGAIFRREGIHRLLRSESSRSSAKYESGKYINVILKFFNKIAEEKGTALLGSGVFLALEAVQSFFSQRRELFPRLECVLLDGVPHVPEEFSVMLSSFVPAASAFSGRIFYQVSSYAAIF